MRAIGYIKFARKFLPRETLRMLYLGLVEPHFTYCCSVWGSCGTVLRHKIGKLQNRAVRIITFSLYNAQTSPLLSGGSRGLRALLKQRSDSQELCVSVNLCRARLMYFQVSGPTFHCKPMKCLSIYCINQLLEGIYIISKNSGSNCSPAAMRSFLWREQPMDSKFLSSTNHSP